VDKVDKEIRKEFKETEKKLKDAGLPAEIMKRHDDMVAHYTQNLSKLRDYVEGIRSIQRESGKAVDQAARAAKRNDLKAKILETRDFLKDKIKKKPHAKLDPNNLPHRSPKPIDREPRLKKEDFLDPAKGPVVDDRKPIQVAALGDLSGLLLALATNAPTAADLAETIEVQFTPDIQAKAAELNHDPVKIFNWVKNSIDFEPYYGSLKGAQQTLFEKGGNDFDQASLLIALFRVSNIPARYVYGTVEIPIEKLMNWLGGFTDPNAAAMLLASAGFPGKLIVEGGRIKSAQMEHVWVDAWIDYIPSRGAVHRQGDTWIPMDPSFKQYEYKPGMDLYSAMGINGEQYIMDYITDDSPSPIPLALEDLFPEYTISPYQFYSKRLLDYVDVNFPDLGIEDIIGGDTVEETKTIIKQDYPVLFATLPYRPLVRGGTYSSVPDTFRHSITLTIEDSFLHEMNLTHSVTLPEVAGKRITLSYVPETSADEALVAQYGGLLKVPPCLLKVKPVIKADGIVLVTGIAMGLGDEQVFRIFFRIPNKSTDVVTNIVTAGDYSALAIQYYKTSSGLIADKMKNLTENIGSTDLDDVLGQMLYNIGLSFCHHLNFEEELYAKNFQMIFSKEPSEAMVTSHAETEYLWGVSYKVTEGGVGIDVDRNIYIPIAKDGNRQRARDFMIISGLGGSAWEHMILESFYDVPSVSAARLLKQAHQQGLPIHRIDSGNLSTVLPQLQVSSEVIGDIKNSVNAGKVVFISQADIQYNEWKGVGYIILDPATGTGVYMISGGTGGADPSRPLPTSQRELDALYARLCNQTRGIIIRTAGALIGTPYRMGAKDPITGYIDCSGLVAYCYDKAGIISLHGKNAQSQYETGKPADYPLYADLAFFRGTYDKNGDGIADEKDGITHVGIALPDRLMIHAGSSKGVTIAPLTVFSPSKFAGYMYVDMSSCK